MIKVQQSKSCELPIFVAMQNQKHVGENLSKKPLKIHQRDYENESTTYLSVYNESDQLVGYFILEIEHATNQIRLRRILIDQNHLGIGQVSILKMEKFCVSTYNTSRIWLDVFDTNQKAVYVYKKLGYTPFSTNTNIQKNVAYYEKNL